MKPSERSSSTAGTAVVKQEPQDPEPAKRKAPAAKPAPAAKKPRTSPQEKVQAAFEEFQSLGPMNHMPAFDITKRKKI